MFGTLQLILAIVIATIAASGATWATRDHYLGVIAKAKVAAQVELDAANKKADDAAIDWQAWAEVQPAKIVYRNRKVADAFKAEPAWAAASIPAAIRLQLDAPAPGADPNSSIADGAVSPAGAASAADQPGSRTGISGLSRFFGRVRQATQRTGQGSDPNLQSEVSP